MKTGTFLKGLLRPCKLNSVQEIAYINSSKMTHYSQNINRTSQTSTNIPVKHIDIQATLTLQTIKV